MNMDKFDFIKDERLKNQIKFVLVIDEMKNIFRRNITINSKRSENDAEHSWHLAMLALIFEEYSEKKVDIERVLKIALCHDLIEVYAGDTFAYDVAANEGKYEREVKEAEELFGILDEEQGKELRALWDEFEEMETPESRYANAMDRLQPLFLNYMTDGHTWKMGDVTSAQIYKRMDIIRVATPELWKIVEGIINISIENGLLKP